ncbi:hypothetical protein K0M31_019121 [Melipona bicolor]|uniref:Peroxidase n=1 Tax=Melipona bicolor TaxID=60889 RepID=A0AA40KQU2_9HYME|nr:hypothetical protein K0M31_019121 [Melipona bicolor]
MAFKFNLLLLPQMFLTFAGKHLNFLEGIPDCKLVNLQTGFSGGSGRTFGEFYPKNSILECFGSKNSSGTLGDPLNLAVISFHERRILSLGDFFVEAGLNENLVTPQPQAQIPAKVNPFYGRRTRFCGLSSA